MFKYMNSLENITEENLNGFFHGWPNPPSAQKFLKILENSNYIWLAIEKSSGNVVGFINSVSDKTLSAYIPLLEVLPEYQKQGIGSELVRLMLNTLKDYYMIDLICDDSLTDFYGHFNMMKGTAMMVRNFKMQCGKQ